MAYERRVGVERVEHPNTADAIPDFQSGRRRTANADIEEFEKKHFKIFEQFEKKQRKIFRLINIQLILKSFQRGKLQRKLEKWEGTENKNRNVSVCMWMKLIVLECDVTLSDRHSTRSVQSEAVYRSQDFVMFFLESCEGLPGQ